MKSSVASALKWGTIIWLVIGFLYLFITDFSGLPTPDGKGPMSGQTEICWESSWNSGTYTEYCTIGEKIGTFFRVTIPFALIVSFLLPFRLFDGGVRLFLMAIFLAPTIAIPIYSVLSYYLLRLFRKSKNLP